MHEKNENREVKREGNVITSLYTVEEKFDIEKAEEVLRMLTQQASGLQVQVQNDERQIRELNAKVTKSRVSKQEIAKIRKTIEIGGALDQMEQMKARLKQSKKQLEQIQKDKVALQKATWSEEDFKKVQEAQNETNS